MNQFKQSFIERLTGTMRMNEEEEIYNSLPEEDVPEEAHAPTRLPRRQEVEEEDPEDGAGTLAIDMYESDNELVIQSMIAGVTPENLNITITRDTVSISGKRISPSGIDPEQFIERELYWGEFSRTIELPYEIDTEGAEAVEKYGLLIIRLPKLNNRSAQLKVKSI